MSFSSSEKGRAQGGYALLEALVAVLIAAIGLVGAARMQTFGFAVNNSTQARQKASCSATRWPIGSAPIRPESPGTPTIWLPRATRPASPALPAVRQRSSLAPISHSGSRRSRRSSRRASGVVCIDSTPDDGSAIAPQCDGTGNVLAVKIWWADKVGSPRFVVALRP